MVEEETRRDFILKSVTVWTVTIVLILLQNNLKYGSILKRDNGFNTSLTNCNLFGVLCGALTFLHSAIILCLPLQKERHDLSSTLRTAQDKVL